MKSLKFIFAISAIASTLLFVACSDQEITHEHANSLEQLSLDSQSEMQQPMPLPQDVKDAITTNGGNVYDYEYMEIKAFTKKPVGLVVHNDVSVTKEEFLDRLLQEDDKQYRTEFLVDVATFTTVDLFVYTGPQDEDIVGLVPAAVTQVQNAVANWNGANSNLVFTVTISDDSSEYDAAIHETLLGAVDFSAFGINASGIAEFPTSNGAPGIFAFINTSVNNSASFFEPETLEHLFTHELGHSIGFRHSDWDTRQSCVDLGLEDEESSENFAQRIFGTFSTFFFQHDSVMNACFADGETDGNPNFMDETSLRRLYGYNLNN